jgi:amino acid adenylation domain-containing protein
VAGIWSEVLGVERVARDDSFFDLGGHSLRATQVISRLRQAFGMDLPLALLFEAPTVAGLAAHVRAALAPAARAAASGGETPAAGAAGGEWAPLPRRAPGDPLTLSFAQERLWFLDQLAPGTPAFNVPGALALAGPLEPAALAAALAAIVRRHEVLRTVLRAVAGRPLQVVLPPSRPPLPEIDLAALPEAARGREESRLRRQEAMHGFDLAAGPLLRTRLLRLGAQPGGVPPVARHLLLLTFHHAAFDGWSIGVLARELAVLYAAAAARRPSPLPELPIQYADFARWQRAWLAGEPLERFAGYWRRQLAGVPPLRLPLDRPRPALQSTAGGFVPIALPAPRAAALRRLARRATATPFMALLAAFAALLHRLSGQADFALGTWVANRTRPEVEGLVGFFVNNLALRFDLGGSRLTYGQLLARSREIALAAYAHQDLPFEKLIEELGLPRDLSLPPLFQVVCVLQNAPAAPFALGDTALELLPPAGERANFDLTLELAESGGGFAGALIYNRDLFDRSTVARLAGHLGRLLASALAGTAGTAGSTGDALLGEAEPWEASAAPEPAVDELSLLSAAERWQLAGEWSPAPGLPAAERRPGAAFVHQLVERQAADRPEAVALVWPGEPASPDNGVRLTYRELNGRANRLARVLRRRGVGPETAVAICLPRGPDLVIAALAAWKAGGCYVPLDPAHGGHRLSFMAADAGARVLVTRAGHAGDTGVELSPGAALLALDEAATAKEIAAEDPADLSPAAAGLRAGHLAYVIYTSGSTGRPKGVMVEHRSLLAAFHAYQWAYRLDRVSAHLQMASFSFDVFTADLVRALGSGARLVLCPRATLLEPRRLFALMHAEQVDGAEFVPAVVRSLVDHLEQAGGSLAAMRLLVVSSDAWYAGEVGALARRCGPGTRLIDSYGVTEATIDSTFLPLAGFDAARRAAAAVVPIGRPLPASEAWVLDRRLQLQPVGVPGELCLGGAGVGRGYLGRPDLTAERFAPHPFAATPGERLYRSGDLVRWQADGNLEFLARVDDQIKVRGFRIEPGEIESALGCHPRVRQAVVLAPALPAGASPGSSRRLIAYVVARPAGPPPEDADLRSFLRARLPDYMVPASFVPIGELPLTANGKVDRRALPAPAQPGTLAAAPRVPPRTPAERLVAGIWGEVLGIADASAHDDFFARGGHSLLATQVAARVRAAAGVELPLRAIFEAPVLAELAQVVEEQLILAVDSMSDEEVAALP